MNYVITAPEMMTAAATDLSNIGSTIGSANASAAAVTWAELAPAADEVSAGVATLFGEYAQAYHAIGAQAAARPLSDRGHPRGRPGTDGAI